MSLEDILAPESREVLERFAATRLLVGLDFDGTLAPIVERPDDAAMRPSTRRWLRILTDRYPCIVISGRAREDVLRRLDDIPLAHVSGNHGLEPWGEKERYVRLVGEWVQHLAEGLRGFEGVVIEDKVFSVSVHYRMAHDKRPALRAISAIAPRLANARRIGGLEVVNFVPADAPGKGVALARARKMLGCDTAIFVGDDDTDEAAFGSAPPGRLLGIRVGHRNRTRASHFIHVQRDIDRLLHRLAILREPAGRAAARPRVTGAGARALTPLRDGPASGGAVVD